MSASASPSRVDRASRFPVILAAELALDAPAGVAHFFAARQEALRAAREIVAERIIHAREDVPRRFLIADAEGQVLDTVHTREVLPRGLLEPSVRGSGRSGVTGNFDLLAG